MSYFNELYIAFIETGERKDAIHDVIQESRRFTDAFRFDPKIKRVGIYAISFDGANIECLAKGKKTGRVATYADRVNFTNFFNVKISIDGLKDKFPPLNDRLINRTGVIRIPPAATKAVFQFIETYGPHFSDWFKNISLDQMHTFSNAGQEERDDSYRLALQIANFDLKRSMVESKTVGNIPLFLKEINTASLNEDEMINHDFSLFGDWDKCKSEIVGMASFEKENEKLFIWNINRKPLESVLGVDLIYFAEEYDSFVMIQYKRMTFEEDKWTYIANDKVYQKEFTNMKKVANISNKEVTADPHQFRLNDCPFYFKLCKSTVEHNKSSEMIPGMYIPLDYWDNLITSSFIRSRKGGISIGYHNAGRWMTKEDFVHLVQKGWIGSNQQKSTVISELIKASIEGDRLVTLAAKFNQIAEK